jgi:F0F1-type ATP synthase membrane subunit b/b'
MVGVWMTTPIDFEHQKKLTKVREELSKREVDVRKHLADIEKIRVKALKKTEEMKYSANHEIERIDHDIVKAKNLDAQAKARLAAEIGTIKSDIEKKYSDLRGTILGKATSPQS